MKYVIPKASKRDPHPQSWAPKGVGSKIVYNNTSSRLEIELKSGNFQN